MAQVTTGHVPVLLEEVLCYLDPRPGEVVIDCTLGGGGHAEAILARLGPTGRLIGIDRDPQAIEAAALRLSSYRDRLVTVRDSFARLDEIGETLSLRGTVHGILFDLGVSSPQLDVPQRGFSYSHDAPLDMRMDPTTPHTAAQLVNELPEEELARILREYGEERWAGRIARFIVTQRRRQPIRTTGQLVEVIKAAVPAPARRRGPHPARRTFQALRIAVNDELGALQRGLDAAIDLLAPGGRLCVISFHSLEDRIVKRTFQEAARGCRCPPELPRCVCGRQPRLVLLTRRPVVPGPAEVEANPRSKSARLRAARRVLGQEEGE